MLKLAVVTRYFPNSAEPWQGRSAYQILRVLAQKADVKVFFPNAMYPSLLKPRSRTYDHLDPSYSPPDVKVSYHDYLALPMASRPFNGWMAARVLLPHVRSFAPDLIHSFFLYPEGYAALKIGKALSVPVVAKGIGSDINRIRDPISAMHTRTVLREADFLLAVSKDLRRKAVAMGALHEKTRAVHNGCDLTVFHVQDRIDARQRLRINPVAEAVVYLGRMDVKKGLRELVEASVALHPQRPNMQVYMVGEGPDRPIIESAIHSHNAANYIHALPPCAFDEVAVWMAAADVVTLPSYMEGCPNVIVEALACGRPVVATNVGGIPEILDNDGGQLVPARDTPALARGLASVLDRNWNAQAISAQHRRSWSDVAAELLEIFEMLVSTRQSTIHAR
jgi:glycosyltransferase involved in cell wall biosynthesis